MVTKAYNGFPAAYRDKQGRKIYNAFRKGELTKPLKCTACGLHEFDGATIHAHNEDYHQPFDFVPLCFCCHMAVHKRFANLTTWHAWQTAVSAGWQPPATQNYHAFMALWKDYKPTVPGLSNKQNWVWSLPDVEPNLYDQK